MIRIYGKVLHINMKKTVIGQDCWHPFYSVLDNRLATPSRGSNYMVILPGHFLTGGAFTLLEKILKLNTFIRTLIFFEAATVVCNSISMGFVIKLLVFREYF